MSDGLPLINLRPLVRPSSWSDEGEDRDLVVTVGDDSLPVPTPYGPESTHGPEDRRRGTVRPNGNPLWVPSLPFTVHDNPFVSDSFGGPSLRPCRVSIPRPVSLLNEEILLLPEYSSSCLSICCLYIREYQNLWSLDFSPTTVST